MFNRYVKFECTKNNFMKIKNYINTLLTLLIITLSSCSKNKQLCIIEGTYTGNDNKSIILAKPYEDLRVSTAIEIPIINGKFKHELLVENPEGYRLSFGKSRWSGGRYINVFLEPGTIKLTIHPESEFDKNEIIGGKQNKEYKDFSNIKNIKFQNRIKPLRDSIEVLINNNTYFSEPMKSILNDLEKEENKIDTLYKKMDHLKKLKLDLTIPAKILSEKIKKIYDEQKKWEQQYINDNQNLLAYYLFYNNLVSNKKIDDVKAVKKKYDAFSSKFKGHPYNEIVLTLISSRNGVQLGKKYTDFSAPTIDGKLIKLSDLIDNKIAIINLWGTWCRPCIAHSKELIPIYEDFKDKGLTVVGVAGEFKNTENLKKFLEKEKFPWLNLVELDEENLIWQKYGVDGTGGGIFLIDKTGNILAISPTAQEIREKLNSILK